MSKIPDIEKDLRFIQDISKKIILILPEFNITDSKVLPYGLKPHTRSVSWIVEQVIVQQSKLNCAKLGLEDVDFNLPDTSLHDCVIKTKYKNYYVNIKVSDTTKGIKNNKNDISAVEKLFMQYTTNKKYDLIFACFGIKFNNLTISFDSNYLHIFSPQFLPIYVNPRNDKIQAKYDAKVEPRSRKKFLDELRLNSKSIVL